jgi:hypothetical protein
MHSVSRGQATEHTDSPVDLELAPVVADIDDRPIREVAEQAAEAATAYTRQRGFIADGTLQSLDHTFVAATELRHVGREIARAARPSEPAERYLVATLRAASDGERPDARVPPNLRAPHGLAAAAAVGDYQRDVRTHLADHPDTEASRLSGRIRDHRKRIEALDGDVDPEDADRLVHATRDLGAYLRSEEESALVTADNWLTGLADGE